MISLITSVRCRARIRRRTSFAAVLTALLVVSGPLHAQLASGATLSGRIFDDRGEPLAGVELTLDAATPPAFQRTAITGAAGEYRLANLRSDSYILSARRLGFVTVERQIQLSAGESVVLDLRLATDPLLLQGVTARGAGDGDRERFRFETEPGVTARVVERQTIRMVPGLAEPDVLRAVALLPGVVSTSDFSSSFNVRGGSADQNLILIDGFTVFNPFHLGGLFGVFNADAVERAELFAGGFGAEFGGRVSSVLNIESRSDIPEGLEVAGGVSLLASRVLVRAPLPRRVGNSLGGEGGSWFVSARRSYFDQLLRPVVDFPYHLIDLQGFAAIGTRGGGRISVTGYSGQDVLDLSSFGLADDGSAADVLRIRWNWGNRVAGLHWRQPLSGGWAVETRAGYTRFVDRLGFLDFGDVNLGSRIEQILWRADVQRQPTSGLGIRFGLAADRLEHRNITEAGGTTFFFSTGDGVLAAGYGSLRWTPTLRWIVEPGVRLDNWRSSGTSKSVLAPRLAAKYFFGPGEVLAVKASAGRYSQFLHSLRDEELPVSNDVWTLAGGAVPPVVSDQLQVGVESFWGAGWSASVEGYLRTFTGVTQFNTAEDPNDPDDDLLVGEGRSRGVDLQLRRAAGRLTGWVSLSLLRATRTMPDPTAAGWDDLPATVTYSPIFDRQLNLDLVAQYATTGGLELGARWNYGSGIPHTRPIAQYFGWRHNPIEGRSEPQGIGMERDGIPTGIVLGPRNAERYPPYHRLDLTARRSFTYDWGVLVPYLQVLNVYNRRNVLFYFYDYNRSPPVRSGFSMFPVLPTIGVEVTF